MSWVFAIVAGWLLADLVSGLVHWAEDRLALDHVPVIGTAVVAPNRLHHAQPMAFTRNGFLSRNGTSVIGTAVLTAMVGGSLWFLFGRDVPDQVWMGLAVATLGGAMANQIHYWAHVPNRAPGIVQAAQTIGLLQSRGHHARHHAKPQDQRYCVLTNWLNPALDRYGIWRRLERIVPAGWLTLESDG